MVQLISALNWNLYDAIPIPCLLLTSDLHIVAANQAYLAESESTKDSVAGQLLFNAIGVDDITEAALRASFDRLLHSKEPETLNGIPYHLTKPATSNEKGYCDIKNVLLSVQETEIPYILHFISKAKVAMPAPAGAYFSGNDFELLVKSVKDYAIFLLDTDGVITSWNEGAERINGYKTAEVLGKKMDIFYLQKDQEKGVPANNLQTAFHQGTMETEAMRRRKDGSTFHSYITLTKLVNDDGQHYGYVKITRDMTIEKENQERKYQQLFQSNPMPMWVLGQKNFRFLAVNDMAILQYGYSREEFLSMTALDIRPENERDLFIKSDHTYITSASNYNKGVWKHRKKNGDIIHVQVMVHEIMFEDTPAKMVLAYDITDIVLTEKQLVAKETFFRSIIENSMEGISLVDESYRNIYRSPAAIRIAGNLTPEGPFGTIHPDDRGEIDSKRTQVLANPGVAIPFMGRFKNGDGHYKRLEGSFNNLLDVEGVQAIVTNFRDVTDRIAAEEKIAASEKQFRTTLNNMMEGVLIIGYDWKSLYANDAVVKGSRLSREEIVGKLLTEAYPWIEGTAMHKAMHRVMEERLQEQLETEVDFPGRTTIFLQLSIQPVPEGIFVLSINTTKRKLAEKEIAKSQRQINTILERISDAFIALDTNWNCVYMNKAAGTLIQRDPHELIGKNIWAEYPEAVGGSLDIAFNRAMETQEPLYQEQYYAPLDLWVYNSIYPSPEGLLIFYTDITGRKKIETELMQSESNMKAIFENSSEGFILTDKTGLVKAFNSNIVNSVLVSVSDEIRKGESIFNLVEPDRKSFFIEMFNRVLGGETIQYDRKYIRKNRKPIWINLVFNPVIKNNEVEGVCITGRDVTEKKKAEDLLKKSFAENMALSERLSTIINTLPASIAMINKNGRIMEVNKAWQNFYANEEFKVGSNYLKVTDETSAVSKGHTDVIKGLKAVLDESEPEFTYEYSLGEKWFRTRAVPLQHKEYSGAVIFHIDISEVKRLEAERMHHQVVQQHKITQAMLQGQEKERNHIGREMHDNINQILAGARMYLSVAGGKSEAFKESIKYPMQLLDQSMEEIRTLCSHMVTPLPEIPLKNMVRDLLDKLKAHDIKVILRYIVPGDPLSDKLKLNIYRIIQELSHNIIKYAKATQVTVSIELLDELHIIVQDDGRGFDATAKRNGIGISNMKSRVSSFNGTIKIESKIGKGTKTTIRLPHHEDGNE